MKIHEESINAVLLNRPDLNRAQLERIRLLMNSHGRDALVNGHQRWRASLNLPDPKDRHVLAAAIECGADVILTFKLQDISEHALAPYYIDACHPDPFLMEQLTLDSSKACAAVRRHRASLKSPPLSVQAFLDTLATQGLIAFPRALSRYGDAL